jgi:tight adherence protein C
MITSVTLVLAAAAAGLAALLLVAGIYNVFVRRVLDAAEAEEETGAAGGIRSVVFKRLASLNRGLVRQDYRNWIRKRLVMGGHPKSLTVDDFLAMQEISGAAFLGIGAVFSAGMGASYLWAVIFLLAGVLYPVIWLRDRVRRRHMEITRALPYNLDLMTLAVEAGLDFQAAVAKTVEKGKQGALAEELSYMLSQLKLGKTREESLKQMAERVDLPALSTFVNALVQADRMGASLGKVLRIQSTQLRNDRSARAEKLAGEAPVKMLFPLIFCIFPTVFLVLFGPILFQFLFGSAF